MAAVCWIAKLCHQDYDVVSFFFRDSWPVELESFFTHVLFIFSRMEFFLGVQQVYSIRGEDSQEQAGPLRLSCRLELADSFCIEAHCLAGQS